ncbi:MAG: 50S ribosomal protein L32 [Pseudomonadota bacterium]
MPVVPKRRQSRCRSALRRGSNSKLSVPSLSNCTNCKRPTLPHRVCDHCGYYKGREIVKKVKAE